MFTKQRLIGLCAVATCCLLSLQVNARTQRDSTSMSTRSFGGDGVSETVTRNQALRAVN